MSFKICNSVRLNAESHADNVSITKVMERLDIATMLQRASMGILDLNVFKRPSAGDVSGTSARKAQEIDALLDQPSTVMDDLFGADRETVDKQMRMFEETARRSRVPKKNVTAEKPNEPENKIDPAKEEPK